MVDQLVVHGNAEACRQGIEAYMAAGVDVTIVSVLPWGLDVAEGIASLAPSPASVAGAR